MFCHWQACNSTCGIAGLIKADNEHHQTHQLAASILTLRTGDNSLRKSGEWRTTGQKKNEQQHTLQTKSF
jgi:hypothetical protein